MIIKEEPSGSYGSGSPNGNGSPTPASPLTLPQIPLTPPSSLAGIPDFYKNFTANIRQTNQLAMAAAVANGEIANPMAAAFGILGNPGFQLPNVPIPPTSAETQIHEIPQVSTAQT